MDKVKIGLIGLGFMGSTHFKIYRDLIPDAQVVAMADVDPVKRKGDISQVVGNIGNDDNSIPLDFTNVKTYDNGFDMIKEADIDMVDICVPTPFHKDLVVAALAAGKHVLSEKPLCRNLAEAEEIRKAVAASDKLFNVDMCVRAWPAYRHAYENFRAGAYGKMRAANFHRISPSVDGCGHWQNWFMYGQQSGGALLDMHLHDTDAICYMFGNPKAVTSHGLTGFVSKDAVDHVITTYDYGDGSLVSAEGTWGSPANAPFEMTFQIYCEKATLRLTPEDYKIYWTDGRIETPDLSACEPTGWHEQFKYFIHCVKNGIKPDKYQTFESVHNSFKVVMAEQESIDKNQTIQIRY